MLSSSTRYAQVAAAASRPASAYIRTSWPYWTASGETASRAAAARPTTSSERRRPGRQTTQTVIVPRTADSPRSATSPGPKGDCPGGEQPVVQRRVDVRGGRQRDLGGPARGHEGAHALVVPEALGVQTIPAERRRQDQDARGHGMRQARLPHSVSPQSALGCVRAQGVVDRARREVGLQDAKKSARAGPAAMVRSA